MSCIFGRCSIKFGEMPRQGASSTEICLWILKICFFFFELVYASVIQLHLYSICYHQDCAYRNQELVWISESGRIFFPFFNRRKPWAGPGLSGEGLSCLSPFVFGDFSSANMLPLLQWSMQRSDVHVLAQQFIWCKYKVGISSRNIIIPWQIHWLIDWCGLFMAVNL